MVENLAEERKEWKAEKEALLDAINKLLKHVEELEAKREEKKTPEVQEKPANSTQVEEDVNKNKKDCGKDQQKPSDFLAWLKQRNSSLESFGNSEGVNNRKESVHFGNDEPEEKKGTGSSRRQPVHKWTVRYDGVTDLT